MNSKNHGKYQFALKVILISAFSNLFPLEFVQKCQCCQFCVLQENSFSFCRFEGSLAIVTFLSVLFTGGGACPTGLPASGGSGPGGCLLGGGGLVGPGGCLLGGGLVLGGSGPGYVETPPPQADGYCCGRYASYWNAFLSYQKYLVFKSISKIELKNI